MPHAVYAIISIYLPFTHFIWFNNQSINPLYSIITSKCEENFNYQNFHVEVYAEATNPTWKKLEQRKGLKSSHNTKQRENTV